ncbi:MAG: hypothetical protein ACK4GL_11790 [Flavobacteriales bacterium]
MKTSLKSLSFILLILFFNQDIDAQAYVTSSPDSVCAGAQNVVYRIPPPANQNSVYNWSVTGAATFTNFSAPVNDSIYVNWPATAGVDFVRVFESAGAGCQGPEAELEVRRYLPTATFNGTATICAGNPVNNIYSVTFSGKKPFSFTYQFTSGGNTIGPFTINNINSNTYSFDLPAIANSGNYTGTIISASDGNCSINNIVNNAVLNVITSPALPVIQHLD